MKILKLLLVGLSLASLTACEKEIKNTLNQKKENKK